MHLRSRSYRRRHHPFTRPDSTDTGKTCGDTRSGTTAGRSVKRTPESAAPFLKLQKVRLSESQQPIRIPEPCGFQQVRNISKALPEHNRVIKAPSSLPDAGYGVFAACDLEAGEVALEVKGPVVHSFFCRDSKKHVTFKITNHQASLYGDDRHILMIDGIAAPEAVDHPHLAHGIDPENTARFLNSSVTGGDTNLLIRTFTDPAVVQRYDGEEVVLKQQPLLRRHLHVFGITTRAVKKGEELLFPYPLASTDHLHKDPAGQYEPDIRRALRAQDPAGKHSRLKHGCFYHQTPDTLIKELQQQAPGSKQAEQIITTLSQLKEHPERYGVQNQLLTLSHPKALDAFMLSVLYRDGQPPARREIYDLCRRLNHRHIPNQISSGEPWSHSDVFLYCKAHSLISPLQEGELMPYMLVAREQAENPDTPYLEQSVRAGLKQGRDLSTLTTNMKRMGVKTADNKDAWHNKAMVRYCAKKKLAMPSGTSREALWNRIRKGDTAAIWEELETMKRNGRPLKDILKELSRHQATLGKRTTGSRTPVTLGDLVEFIDTTASPVQRRRWLGMIRRYMKAGVSETNRGRMIVKGIKATNNQWLLLNYLEIKIKGRSKENIFLVRNMNKNGIPFPAKCKEWTPLKLCLYLRRNGRQRLAEHYIKTVGVKARQRLGLE